MDKQNKGRISGNVGFIGGGNMARAIFDGIVSRNVVYPKNIIIAGPREQRLEYFQTKGASITTDNGCVVDNCDIIFICVKPMVLETAVQEILKQSRTVEHNKIFVSILAGTSIKTIENAFKRSISLIRVMPNTAVAVLEGCCVYARNSNVSEEGMEKVEFLLKSTGLCFEVPEYQINAIGALSGSGPAFMYTILESLADGGVKMGIPREHAIKLAGQTMLGAAKMVLQSGKHSAQLKDEVCSAGGTTITGIHALEKGGVRSAIIDAIEAATNRSIEMDKLSMKRLEEKDS